MIASEPLPAGPSPMTRESVVTTRAEYPARVGSPPTVAVAGIEFGWGSAGKLAAIIDSLSRLHDESPRLLGLGSQLGRRVLARHRIAEWADLPESDSELSALLDLNGVVAAVVVLDSHIAHRLETVGCPVVYVDSLPFLWTDGDDVPWEVTRYCAQLCPSLPEPSWRTISKIERLHWVQNVISVAGAPTAPVRPGTCLVNVGGLQSPFSHSASSPYLAAILGPVLGALHSAGCTEVTICGNVDHSALEGSDMFIGMSVECADLPHDDFIAALSAAEIVLTSPGRTTLLELAALDRCAVVLPPQNLSQIQNAAEAAALVMSEAVVPWPTGVFHDGEIERLAALDEGRAVRYIYERIGFAAGECAVSAALLHRTQTAITAVRNRPHGMSAFSLLSGLGGADQVTAHLVDVIRNRQMPVTRQASDRTENELETASDASA